MERRREGCGFFCSLKVPYLRTMSQKFCHRLYSLVIDLSFLDDHDLGEL